MNKLARKENINIDYVGTITNTGNIKVLENLNIIVDLPLEPLLRNREKTLTLQTTDRDLQLKPMKIYEFIEDYLNPVS